MTQYALLEASRAGDLTPYPSVLPYAGDLQATPANYETYYVILSMLLRRTVKLLRLNHVSRG